MDENSVSFQRLHLVQKAKFLCSNTVRAILGSLFFFVCFFVRGEHAKKPKFEKKNFIRHFARFNFSRLSLAFSLKYYSILHAVKR